MTSDDYYDIDGILAEEEQFPVTFLTKANRLGFLDSACQKKDLSRDSRFELPAWIAAPLASRLFVIIDEPKCYAHRFRTLLLADPVVINLRERSPFYYESGLRLASFMRNGKVLVETLVRVLALRCGDILDKSQNSRDEDLSVLTAGMTELERRIFEAGHEATADMYRFKRRITSLNGTSFGSKRIRTM